MLTFALPAGRMLQDCLFMLERIGITVQPVLSGTRKLLVQTEDGSRIILARPSDVPTYVMHGAADIGIVGKDVLLEDNPDVYELLDLGFGRGRFVVAVPRGGTLHIGAGIRVATKFPRITTEYFRSLGVLASVIHLKGAVELAPLAGLSDAIVDIVSTGRTLAENGLVIERELFSISARLISSRAAFGLKDREIERVLERIRRETSCA